MSVRDEDFELFIEEFGEATHTDKVPENRIVTMDNHTFITKNHPTVTLISY